MELQFLSRHIEPILDSYVRQFSCVALTGPRQSGKSRLLREKYSASHKYLTFDDPLLQQQAESDPRMFIESAGPAAIIDEIQHAPGLLPYLKMEVEKDRGRKGRFLLTGSQQFALIRGLGESLSGRVGILELMPLSARERPQQPGRPADLLAGACMRGLYPEPALDALMEPRAWYASYLRTYLERDVRGLHDIGNLRDFQRLMRFLASRCGQLLDLSSAARELGVAVNTVKRWISVLEASRIVYLLPPYFNNLGKRVTKAPKLHFLDCGLVCYLTAIRSEEQLLQGPLAGPLFENFCVQETVKTFFNLGEVPGIYHLRTHNGLEVDLLVETPQGLVPAEVKLTKTPRAAMASPLRSFRGNFAPLEPAEGAIITLAPEASRLAPDVEAVPLSSFLDRIEASLRKGT